MKPESLHNYDALPDENELVERYHPRFLDRGGDHLVYELIEHPDVVVKASTFRIKDILTENSESGVPLDSLSEELKAQIEAELKEKDQQSRNLRNYFGNEHTLAERRYLMKVPVTGDILFDIFKDDWKNRLPPLGSLGMEEAWSSVVVQKRTEAISDPNHLSLNFGGFEEEGEYDDTAIKNILTQAEQDPALKNSLKEFVSKAVSYANETGNILAMAGKNNIIFCKDGDAWSYLLVDALPIHTEPVFKISQEISQKLARGEEITPHEKTLLMKGANFVRTINDLSKALGMEEKLEIKVKD